MSFLYVVVNAYYSPFQDFRHTHFGGFITTFLIFVIYNLIRYRYLNTVKYNSDYAFLLLGCIDLFNLSYYFDVPSLDQSGKVVIMFILIIAGIYRGRGIGIILTLLWFPMKIVSDFIFLELVKAPEPLELPGLLEQGGPPSHQGPSFHDMMAGQNIIDAVYFQIILLILVLITDVIYRQIVNKERENKNLLIKLEQQYKELETAHDEIEVRNSMLVKSNEELEKANKKLADSIGEFFTLHQISQAISSILNMDELIKFVNDIALGVMGVKSSTIILYNEKQLRLEVNTTNIKNKEDYKVLIEKVNCKALLNVLEKGEPIYDNNVDPNEYVFAEGRDVKSLICVPITAKVKKFGLILLEQDFPRAFDSDKVRLLTIIAQQVGMAMENAELYQRMQELAVKDNLTGAYNRMYFSEKIKAEFENAQRNKAEGAIVMFDIDYFKKINDTYGHLFGDKVLKTLSELVMESIRSNDVLARIGGEEFIILFPNISLTQACEVCERLRKKIEVTAIKDNSTAVSVSASFGITAFPGNYSNTTELLKSVDDALYDAKKSGRNCIKTA